MTNELDFIQWNDAFFNSHPRSRALIHVCTEAKNILTLPNTSFEQVQQLLKSLSELGIEENMHLAEFQTISKYPVQASEFLASLLFTVLKAISEDETVFHSFSSNISNSQNSQKLEFIPIGSNEKLKRFLQGYDLSPS